jgi:hypothetical protein
MRIGWSRDNNTANGAHEAFSDLSAHASRRLLWLGFEVHYLAHLIVCRTNPAPSLQWPRWMIESLYSFPTLILMLPFLRVEPRYSPS